MWMTEFSIVLTVKFSFSRAVLAKSFEFGLSEVRNMFLGGFKDLKFLRHFVKISWSDLYERKKVRFIL